MQKATKRMKSELILRYSFDVNASFHARLVSDKRSPSRCSEVVSGVNSGEHKCGIRQDYHWVSTVSKVADKPLTLDTEG